MNRPQNRGVSLRPFAIAFCLAASVIAVGTASARNNMRSQEFRLRAAPEQEFRIPMRLDEYRGNWIRELVALRAPAPARAEAV